MQGLVDLLTLALVVLLMLALVVLLMQGLVDLDMMGLVVVHMPVQADQHIVALGVLVTPAPGEVHMQVLAAQHIVAPVDKVGPRRTVNKIYFSTGKM
jgi:hypothetical protein